MIRTTVTMNRKLYKSCKDLMDFLGYGNNFSEFISEAARAERFKMARQQAVLRKAIKAMKRAEEERKVAA